MVVPTAGAVVLVLFPFSDLSQTKLRPAIVLANAGRNDWIMCQITSKPYGDSRAINLGDTDFRVGGLRMTSYARPGKLFTGNENLLSTEVGKLTEEAYKRNNDAVVDVLRSGVSP